MAEILEGSYGGILELLWGSSSQAQLVAVKLCSCSGETFVSTC